MEGKEMMKVIYTHFGEKKENNQEMHSIANVLFEMGIKEEPKEVKNETTMFVLHT